MKTLKEVLGWSSKQIYSDNNGEWSVDDIIEYAKTPAVIDIPIEMLEHNLEPSENEIADEVPGSSEFIERAEKSDLRYPIIVIAYPDGMWIADGVHRLWKAKSMKKGSIRGYIIAHEVLAFLPKHSDL